MRKTTIGEKNWQTLLSLFPSNWRELARETGASTRLRGVPALEALMRLLVLHLGRGYSLQETVGRAKATGLAEVSAVALWQRLRSAEEWCKEVCVARLPVGLCQNSPQ